MCRVARARLPGKYVSTESHPTRHGKTTRLLHDDLNAEIEAPQAYPTRNDGADYADHGNDRLLIKPEKEARNANAEHLPVDEPYACTNGSDVLHELWS